MHSRQNDIITDHLLNESIRPRHKLLPTWIKVFSWIFLIYGIAMPIVIIWGLITHNFAASIYGLDSFSLYSISGITIIAIFILKAIVAFSLLKYKDWGVKLGVIDALFGILFCAAIMLYELFQGSLNFRLELIALIPYFIQLKSIKKEWEIASDI